MGMTVDVAFLFAATATSDALKAALTKVLAGKNYFAPVAGRMQRRDGKIIIMCNNAGVPITFTKEACVSPDMGAPIHADYFDIAKDYIPATDDTPGKACCRIKVSDFSDGKQLIAVSISHGLADAKSIGTFMHAWAAAYQGKAISEANHDRSVAPPTPAGFGAAPLSDISEAGIPQSYKDHWAPFDMAGMGLYPKYSPAVTVYGRSSEDCTNLKAKHAKAGENLSTNDALVGEVAELLDIKDVALVMEWREALGTTNLFGCGITTIEVRADSPANVPSALRALLPSCRSKEFITWKCGAGAAAVTGAICNSWARAFNLSEICFEAPAADLMISDSMCRTRAAAFAGFGGRYTIVLPQTSGVKVVLWGPSDLKAKLGPNVLSCVEY